MATIEGTSGADTVTPDGASDGVLGGLPGAEADSLIGLGEADRLAAGEGADTLDGGEGADTLEGGAGDDILLVDDAGDVLLELPGEGRDRVLAAVSWVLGGGIEDLELLGSAPLSGAGNEADNLIIGNAGANSLAGAEGADTLIGGEGADTLAGGAGDDLFLVETGDVVLEAAGGGLDLVQSSGSFALGAHVERLTLTGTAASAGTGNALDNVITGHDGANTLDGAAGADTLIGGLGNDVYVLDSLLDVIVETPDGGLDTLRTALAMPLPDRIENLVLLGNAAIAATGNALDNLILGNGGANTLDGGEGADTLDGGAGDDVYIVGAGDVVAEAGTGGTDLVRAALDWTLGANIENLLLLGADPLRGTGNTLNNLITGNAGNNSLAGGDGADTLDGRGGADTLNGGQGNDVFVVDSPDDVLVEGANHGLDLVRASVSFTLAAQVENLLLLGTDPLAGTGNTLGNLLTGNAATNTLEGLGGADTLVGLGGADRLVGGTGNDVYEAELGDILVEEAGGGIDTVRIAESFALAEHFENMVQTGTAALLGLGNAAANQITGNGGASTLDGAGGNDTLDGGSGADSLEGGAGADSLVGGTGSDTLSGGDGNDTLAPGAGPGEHVLGGAGDDRFDLNAVANLIGFVLDGGEGFDVADLIGGTLQLGNALPFAGIERIEADGTQFVATGGQDILDFSAIEIIGGLRIATGSGNDRVVMGAVTLAGGEPNILSGEAGADTLVGSALADSLSGGDGNDSLDGGAGADTLLGGAGNDVYRLDGPADQVSELDGLGQDSGGADTVVSSFAFTLGAQFEGLELLGSADLDGTGNALDNAILGNAGANRLRGLDGADTLIGGEGADTLEGGGGNDRLLGGEGNDRLDPGAGLVQQVFGEGGDDFVDLNAVASLVGSTIDGGAGFDRADLINNSLLLLGTTLPFVGIEQIDNFQTSFRGTAGADVYDFSSIATFTPRFNISFGLFLFAGAGDDRVTTGDAPVTSGSHVLNGEDGADTLTGGSQIDLFQGGNGDDSLSGGGGGDSLNGGAGADTLVGGAGADTMIGGTGNDVYRVDDATDAVTEGGNAGDDLVLAFVDFALGAHLERLTLGGGALSGTGNGLANLITGQGGANTLLGAGGADTLLGLDGNDSLNGGPGADLMEGGAGSDRYVVDDPGDVVVEGADAGTDQVTAGLDWSLGENIENLVLTGAAVAGTGNALVNRITGNAAGNLLSGLDGNDVLAGEEGADTLVGGQGADALTGGAGADRFLFGAPGEGVDRIADFVSGEDLVVLLAAGFEGLAAGALAAEAFVAHASNVATAPEGVAQVIYNTEAGVLFFDPDGIGGAAAQRLAVLTGAPALTAADLLVG